MNKILKYSFVIWLILSIIYIIVSLFFCKTIFETPSYTINDIKSIAKSGDMILFSTDDLVGRTIRFWSNDYYSHSAILFNINNDWYIWEADILMNEDQLHLTKKQGPRLSKLDDKLYQYNHCKAKLFPLKQKLNIDDNNIIDILKKYKNIKFEDNPLIWYLADFKLYFPFIYNKNKMFCSELIADTYQKLNIINNKLNPRLFTFKDLRHQNIFNKSILFQL